MTAVIRNHEKVAGHYRIPSINLAREVTERIKRKEFTWKDDFKSLHPAPFGHRIYSNSIGRLLDAAWSEKDTGENPAPYPLPDKLDPYCYDSGKLLPPDKADALKGFKLDPKWENTVGGGTREGFANVPMLVGDQPGNSFELGFKGSAVGLFVAAGPDAGIIEFKIDGGPWTKRDLFTRWSGGLHIPWLHVLASELNPDKTHRLKVRISIEKNSRSKGYACRIVNFAVNGVIN